MFPTCFGTLMMSNIIHEAQRHISAWAEGFIQGRRGCLRGAVSLVRVTAPMLTPWPHSGCDSERMPCSVVP